MRKFMLKKSLVIITLLFVASCATTENKDATKDCDCCHEGKQCPFPKKDAEKALSKTAK